ncbi:MAG: peptide-methionine (S)-S-oxide reductase [Deltaproteobacteria bacterium]|nr:peptide-methionine (S)-S-oxide reductase [Deltaproteobacteria bacterium]
MRTRAGYAGGTKENPTYYSLGDHSETVQIDYDPSVIPYGELLDMFWAYHDPTEPSSCQYAAIVFCHDEKQRTAAEDSKDRLERRIGRTVLTQIRHYVGFYLAEDYHQKFYLRGTPEFFKEMSAYYPLTRDLVNSTAATRINGYLGGLGSIDAIRQEIDGYGLSPSAQRRLLVRVEKRQK